MPLTPDSEWRNRFLEAAREAPTLAAACRRAGVARSVAAAALREDPEFATRVEDALANSLGEAEEAVFERGVRGYDEPVIYKGERVPVLHPDTGEPVRDEEGRPVYHTVKTYNPHLLKLYLVSRAPETYGGGGKSATTPGADGAAAPTAQPMYLENLTPEEMDQLERLLAKAAVRPE